VSDAEAQQNCSLRTEPIMNDTNGDDSCKTATDVAACIPRGRTSAKRLEISYLCETTAPVVIMGGRAVWRAIQKALTFWCVVV